MWALDAAATRGALNRNMTSSQASLSPRTKWTSAPCVYWTLVQLTALGVFRKTCDENFAVRRSKSKTPKEIAGGQSRDTRSLYCRDRRQCALYVGDSTRPNCPPAPPHVPLQKTIGGVTKPEVVPSLIVLNAQGVSLQGNKLVLTGVAPNSIVFADRPVRAAGHDLTSHIIEDWAMGTDNFAKDPPNATVSAFSKDGSAIRDAVVVLKTPKLEGDRLIFDVDVLEGNLTGADGAVAIFIDIIGRPFTPLSFAGVARRTAFRGAMYRSAAYGAAAYGAAAAEVAATNAFGPLYGASACGYYPYPPCY